MYIYIYTYIHIYIYIYIYIYQTPHTLQDRTFYLDNYNCCLTKSNFMHLIDNMLYAL